MRQAFNVAVLVAGGASSVPLSCGLRAGPARGHRQGVAVVPVGACREPWHPMARSWSAMRTPVALESLVSAVCTIPPPLSDTAIFARRAVVYVWKMLSPGSGQDPKQALSSQVNGAFASKAPAQPLDGRKADVSPRCRRSRAHRACGRVH